MLRQKDYSELLTQAKQDNNFNYLLEKYNISEKTQKHCGIGFVKEWKSPLDDKDNTTPPRPCCIIPHSKNNYVAVDTDFGERKQVGETEFFNAKKALKSPTPFIVRDEITAMSIIEAGGEAMALCNNKKTVELLRLLQEQHSGKNQCFIFALNDTDDGEKHQNNIVELIDRVYSDINYITARINRKKTPLDINGRLKKDKYELEIFVEKSLIEARSKIEIANIPKPSSGMDVTSWLRDTSRPPEILVKTGFKELDRILKGGLTAGLHFIGAAPGTGKTALCLQMADQMANAGTEVLFFTLEMSKYELGARSVSRHTFIENRLKKIKKKPGKEEYVAKTALEIRNSGFYPEYTKEEKQAIYKAIDDYEQYAAHVHFYERDLIYKKECPVETMIAAIDEFAKKHKRFVVFVDYIQLVGHQSNGDSERQTVENAVYALKAASLKYNIPIMAISSVNRGSYLEPMTMASYKETGAIDFTASSLFGLQYLGADYTDKDTSEQKRKIRIAALEKKIYAAKEDVGKDVQLQLKIIKARDAFQKDVIFNAKLGFNYFEESLFGNVDDSVDDNDDDDEPSEI